MTLFLRQFDKLSSGCCWGNRFSPHESNCWPPLQERLCPARGHRFVCVSPEEPRLSFGCKQRSLGWRKYPGCTHSLPPRTARGAQQQSPINLRHEPLQICALLPRCKPLHCARLMEKDRPSAPFRLNIGALKWHRALLESGTVCFYGRLEVLKQFSVKPCHIHASMYTLTELRILITKTYCVLMEPLLPEMQHIYYNTSQWLT